MCVMQGCCCRSLGGIPHLVHSVRAAKILLNQHHHHQPSPAQPSDLSKIRPGKNKNNGISPTGNRTLASCELFQRNDKQKY
jgi:hypothetical protein